MAGATRLARAEATERRMAGGGALGGTHRLQRGPIGAYKKACGGKVGHALTTRDPDRPRGIQAHSEHGASRAVLGVPSDPTEGGQSRAPIAHNRRPNHTPLRCAQGNCGERP